MSDPDASRCPACHGPNACAMAAGAKTAQDCWCAQVAIPAERLRELPPASQGKACLCRHCAVEVRPDDES